MSTIDNQRDEDWLTPAEVASWFGVHPRTVVRWANEGKIRFRKTPGGHRRYHKSQFDESSS